MDPKQLHYTKEHEWIGTQDGLYVVGITDHAAEQLGDVTYVELPDAGTEVALNEEVAVVESVKAASDVYSPLAGVIAEANEALEATPELVNQDPYGDGWFFKLKDVDTAGLDGLMDHAAYQEFLKEQD
ncbi:MAG: glycine cleavage system protein GcvH [Candidatus Hydrogenedentota bacterium]